jgi:hypothetical protein
MNPQMNDMQVDKILSQFSNMYRNDDKGMICELILPRFKVIEKSGKYGNYGKENLRVYGDAINRAPGTRAMQIDYTVSLGDYNCQEKSIEKRVPYEFMVNIDDPYDPKRDTVAIMLDNMKNEQENALATVMSADTIMTNNTTLAGGDQWNETATSDPLDDIATGIEAVAVSGIIPNTAIFSRQTFAVLKRHPDIREQIKYTSTAMISDEEMKRFLMDFYSLDKILVGTGQKVTSLEGQDITTGAIWGKHAWIGFTNSTPSLMSTNFGLTFTNQDRVVDTYNEISHKSEVIRVSDSYDQNIFDVNLMYFIKNAIA